MTHHNLCVIIFLIKLSNIKKRTQIYKLVSELLIGILRVTDNPYVKEKAQTVLFIKITTHFTLSDIFSVGCVEYTGDM